MPQSDDVLLEDETLRDGLQMEQRVFSLEEKLDIYTHLKNSGIQRIQVGSFVHPKYVPQMADTDEFIREIKNQGNDGPLLTGLILNSRGLDRALNCGLSHLSMSVSISNSHSIKNAGKPAAEALIEMSHLIQNAMQSGVVVRAGLQCAFGCVYDGKIEEQAVLNAAEKFINAGASEINLADSTGMANPQSVRYLVNQIRLKFPETPVSLHLHDTRGLGLANMYAGYCTGVRTFDVCSGGLGGCPYVRGASGNVPTEDAVNMFSVMGVATNIDIQDICATVAGLERILERKLPGRMCSILASGIGNCGSKQKEEN
ncbi:hydroxymethylglutaryl-CoA lyase [Desulfosediminicola flagellatus]|uniref:hydroxymethylglutaryl-CoA lyase n=1 Tax=Desulfosediminicola flagellatus TaxID=2569541 RepID=UPI0010AB63B1|nr:hydroxymethylglutaryl-CoA lyase [Desulfosediminicola flagellatus]